MSSNFEDRVTLGLAQWITLVEENGSEETLRIGLTHNSEKLATEKSLYFTAVTKVLAEWDDRNDECMESIIAAHEEKDGDQLRYLFHTEQRRLWIWTKHRVAIL